MHMFILCVCGGKDINSSRPSQGISLHKPCENVKFIPKPISREADLSS